MMSIEKKTALLAKIYGVYDEFAAGLDSACQKYCAHCCTSNVSITTLEGYFLIRDLDPHQRTDLKRALEKRDATERFRPQLTTNRLAELCRQGEELPEEIFSTKKQNCPLLRQNVCPVYLLRPFGCRCFVSKISCGNAGVADMDEFVLTVNTVFLQTIEHLDNNGCTGNLIDVVLCLLSAKNRHAYREGRLECHSDDLIANKPLSVLMVPPEHREGLQPILAALNTL
jgi:Fe-S-cluster containining protein